jgi:hypothetical protein
MSIFAGGFLMRGDLRRKKTDALVRIVIAKGASGPRITERNLLRVQEEKNEFLSIW